MKLYYHPLSPYSQKALVALYEANAPFEPVVTNLFDPAVRAIRKLVASGEMGALGMINSFNYTNFLYRPRRPEELDTSKGGGILFNQVPHQIDTARLIGGGRVRSVRAQASVLDPLRPTEGSCVAFLQFEGGVAASLVYSGYDHFDSDEWHFGISERGSPARRLPRSSRAAVVMSCLQSAGSSEPIFANGLTCVAHSTSLRYTLPTPQNRC